MAISPRAEGTWATITATSSVTIPSGGQVGDRMYLIAFWKDRSVTGSVTGWKSITSFIDGAVATGNGVGSVRTSVWYKDHTGSESDPTLTLSGGVIGGAVIVIFSKDASDGWKTPLFATAAITNWTNSSQTVTASTNPDITAGDLVIGAAGIRDDSGTFTRPTDGINATGITWAGNYVEYPATHFSTTTGNDLSGDAGYRIASSGTSSAAPTMTATINAAETGSAVWVVQGVETGLSPYATYVQSLSPIAYYRLGEASGTVIDTMGLQNGTTVGTVTRDDPGAPILSGEDGAITLAATGAISISDNSAFDGASGAFTNAFTVVAWVKNTSRPNEQAILSKQTNSVYIFIAAGANDGRLVLAKYNTSDLRSSSVVFTDSEWHHIAVLHEPSVETAIYFDGALVSVNDGNGTTYSGNSLPISLGNKNATFTADNAFIGSIDEVAIFNTTLTASDISKIYASRTSVTSGSTEVRAYAQAQARIKRTYVVHAQAQARIAGTEVKFAQAQARIKQTYRGFAQAQTVINTGIYSARDTFTRSVSNGFGTTDTGPTWDNTAAAFSTNGSVGIYTPANTNLITTSLRTVTTKYQVMHEIDFMIPSTGTGTGTSEIWLVHNDFYFNGVGLLINLGTLLYDIVGNIWSDQGPELNSAQGPLSTNTWYRFKTRINMPVIHSVGTVTNDIQVKIYDRAGVEPTWSSYPYAYSGPILYPISYPSVRLRSGNTNSNIQVDNYLIELGWQEFGQAQARIKQTYRSYAQTQAQIKQTYFGLGQAQARVKQTYNGLAQGQADIKQTYRVFAQGQAQIVVTYFGLAQAQALIKATYFALAQAQTRVKQTYYGLGQAQADIKQTYYGLGQANAWIEQTYYGLAQSQAWVEATYNSFGQAQARIKTTYYAHSNAQGTILTNYQAFSQAQAQIKQIYYGPAQAESWIEQTYNQFGQAQSQIKQTYFSLAQAQGTILTTYQAYAQAEAKIAVGLATYEQVAQAQAQIKQTYYGLGQAQAWIEQTYFSLAQAQGTIKQVYFSLAQSEAWIEQTYYGLAQAQASILQLYTVHGQSQANIKQTYAEFAQAQGNIKQVYYGLGQAQAQIKQVYYGLGQAEGWIKTTYNGFAQTQADIKQIYQAYGQSQAWIEDTYNNLAQAQAWILSVYYGLAQANADILATSNAFAQAQGTILTSYQAYAQAQAQIKQTYNGFGQTQGHIKRAEYGLGQCQAYIYTPQYARPIADISNNGWRGVVI